MVRSVGPGDCVGATRKRHCYGSHRHSICRSRSASERGSGAAPDVIVNAAAYTDVERAELEEQRALTVNGVSVGELAAAARESAACR